MALATLSVPPSELSITGTFTAAQVANDALLNLRGGHVLNIRESTLFDPDDITPALQECIDAIGSDGRGMVVIPPLFSDLTHYGWDANSRIMLPANVHLRAFGEQSKIIVNDSEESSQPAGNLVVTGMPGPENIQPYLHVDLSAGRKTGICISGLWLDCNGPNQPSGSYTGILTSNSEEMRLVDCHVENTKTQVDSADRTFALLDGNNDRLRVIGGQYSDGGYDTVSVRRDSFDSYYSGVTILDGSRGSVQVTAAAVGPRFVGCTFVNNLDRTVGGNVSHAFFVHSGEDITLVGCTMRTGTVAGDGISIFGDPGAPCSGLSATGCLVISGGDAGITVSRDVENARFVTCKVLQNANAGQAQRFIQSDANIFDTQFHNCTFMGGDTLVSNLIQPGGNDTLYESCFFRRESGVNHLIVSHPNGAAGLKIRNCRIEAQSGMRSIWLRGATTDAIIENNQYRGGVRSLVVEGDVERLRFRNNQLSTDTQSHVDGGLVSSMIAEYKGNINLGTAITETERSFTAEIVSTQTSVTVAHDLLAWKTLTVADFQVTPTEMGDATKFWISNVTATEITITVDADPGASGASFVIRADASKATAA